jgi:hypothetical protein
MTLRSIETDADRRTLIRFLEGRDLPFTVKYEAGRKRSTDQNRLQRQWMNDLASQLPDYDAEGWRAYCKLHFGIAIRKAADEEYADTYDKRIRPLPYELKLSLMRTPMDLPVTRDMSSKQMTQYLDQIHKHFTEQGVVLTDPGDLLAKADAEARRAA